ncbi:MAG TPA: TRAM domain-containing protein [Treponemataceae bacterium]|nr:TRAM domain-containing protein [Treponemataceae bacterium]
MTSIAEKMVPGGSCLARVDGKAVFVPGALPGEAVELRVVKDKKDYAVADIIRVIEPSSHRVEPACPLFGRCGGCDLQMASAAYQRELRVGILREALARARVGDVPAVSCEGGDDWGY